VILWIALTCGCLDYSGSILKDEEKLFVSSLSDEDFDSGWRSVDTND